MKPKPDIKIRNIEKHTHQPFLMMTRETFWHGIDNRVFNAKTALALFCLLRLTDYDSGKHKKVSYTVAAQLLGFHESQIYRARQELIKAGWLDADGFNGFEGSMPRVRMLFMEKKKKEAAKKEKPFFVELDQNIVKFLDESGGKASNDEIQVLYDNLHRERANRKKNKWRPSEELSIILILDKLIEYAPSESPARSFYRTSYV